MTLFLETGEGVTSKEAETEAEAGQNFGRKLNIMGSRDDSFLVWKTMQLISRRLAWMVHDAFPSPWSEYIFQLMIGPGNLGCVKALILDLGLYGYSSGLASCLCFSSDNQRILEFSGSLSPHLQKVTSTFNQPTIFFMSLRILTRHLIDSRELCMRFSRMVVYLIKLWEDTRKD